MITGLRLETPAECCGLTTGGNTPTGSASTIGTSNTGAPEAMRPLATPCHTPRFCAWADGPNAMKTAHKPARATTRLVMTSPFSYVHMGTFTGNASDILYRRSARFAVNRHS
jgi:hypothetical protein